MSYLLVSLSIGYLWPNHVGHFWLNFTSFEKEMYSLKGRGGSQECITLDSSVLGSSLQSLEINVIMHSLNRKKKKKIKKLTSNFLFQSKPYCKEVQLPLEGFWNANDVWDPMVEMMCQFLVKSKWKPTNGGDIGLYERSHREWGVSN